MRINSVEIPEIAMEIFRGLIEEAPSDIVLDFAKRDPSVAKGFRLKPSSAPGIRSRIAAMLNQSGEMNDDLRTFLTIESHFAIPIMSLAPLVILAILPSLRVLHGPEVSAAALLDERQEVREAAMKLFDKVEETDEALAEAEETVSEILGHVTHTLMPESFDSYAEPYADEVEDEKVDRDDDAAVDMQWVKTLQDAVVRLEEEIARLKVELEHAHVRAQHVKSLEKKVEKAEKQSQEARRSCEQEQRGRQVAEAEAARIREQAGAAEKRARQCEAEIEIRTNRRVSERMESVLNAWLLPLQAADETAQAGRTTANELLDRAQRALDKQSTIDRHAGNLGKIRKRRDALNAALQSVTQAEAEAVHPAPELASVREDLRREIAQLDATLKKTAPEPGPAAARILGRINAADTVEDVQTIRRLLVQLDDLEVFGESERLQIYRAYNRRMAIEYGSHGPRVLQAAHWDDPVWQLRQAAANAQQLVLMIDGHNVLHRLTDMFAADFENDAPMGKAREHLVSLVYRMFYSHPECDVRLYFDSPEYSQRRHGANLREIYSGGGEEEHRADNAIVRDLDVCCTTMSAMPRLLVTDDRDLRQSAEQRGARIVPVAQFGALLDDLR